MAKSRTMSRRGTAGLLLLCPWMLAAQNVTYSSIPTSGVPVSITLGPDGNLWILEAGFSASTVTIARLTTAGVLTEFPTNISPGGTCFGSIARGPDNNLWVALGNAPGAGNFWSYSESEHLRCHLESIPDPAIGQLRAVIDEWA